MLVLGINTTGSFSQIALVNQDKVFDEKSWKAENNESEFLLPMIQELLGKNKWEDINKIFVINGPGPFTALRVAIAVANAIAYGLNIPIIGISAMDYWKQLFDGEFVLNAGQNRVYYNGEVLEFDKFLNSIGKGIKLSGYLKGDQMEILHNKGIKWTGEENLATFGNVILKLIQGDFKGMREKEIVEPLYFFTPVITKSTKSYK